LYQAGERLSRDLTAIDIHPLEAGISQHKRETLVGKAYGVSEVVITVMSARQGMGGIRHLDNKRAASP
jgi:hypothetical protein